jgi:acetyl-CoA carboxylase biotin carboxyl carrier protein
VIVRTVTDLVDVMSRGGITELDLDYLDVRVRLRAGQPTVAVPTLAAAPAPVAAPAALPASTAEQGHAVTAPMVGTFYSAPSPQDPPFVKVGDRVSAGQVIGIIEAMKIMNEIASDADGVVTQIVATNAQPVEYGSPLIRLSQGG